MMASHAGQERGAQPLQTAGEAALCRDLPGPQKRLAARVPGEWKLRPSCESTGDGASGASLVLPAGTGAGRCVRAHTQVCTPTFTSFSLFSLRSVTR